MSVTSGTGAVSDMGVTMVYDKETDMEAGVGPEARAGVVFGTWAGVGMASA